MRSEADALHRCYAVTPHGTPALDYQGEFCLAEKHLECPYFVEVDLTAPPEEDVRTGGRSRLVQALPWLLLGVALLAVIGVYGRDLLLPAAGPGSGATAVVATGPRSAPATPSDSGAEGSNPAVEPTGPGSPGTGRYSTPVPEPEGRILTLTPRPGDTGWWSSAETRGRLGDSFLYAGFYQGQAFVAAARFGLGSVPRGAPIREAAVVLTGLNEERFDASQGGAWNAQLLALAEPEALDRSDFQDVYNAPVAAALFPTLFPVDIGRGVANVLPLDAAAREWLAKQVVDGVEAVTVRITGPSAGESVFAWDGGTGPATAGEAPRLVLSLGAPPPTPPPFPTENVIVATDTPTPANVMTVAARATAPGTLTPDGGPTPWPYRLVTPTPFPANLATVQALALLRGLPPVVQSTPTPGNRATATFQAGYATAVAMTTGTFTPVPKDAVTPVIVVPSPIPQNVMTVAAQMRTATAVARVGTPTSMPWNAVFATPTEERFIIVSTPTPENAETAQAFVAYATAVAMTTGTFTPIPANAIRATATRTMTPVPLVWYVDQMTPGARPTLSPTPPSSMPTNLKGKILFRSDRDGREQVFSYDPATKRLAYVTQEWPYPMALRREPLASDGQRSVIVANDSQQVPQVYVRDARYPGAQKPLTWASVMSYDPVWSPADDRIAFVSDEPGNAEIFTIRPDASDPKRLTSNSWEWDKHPSWSPDGSQIVFWSNRITGRRQLWIMNADGSSQRILMETPYNDWDPIWVK